jgi:hypothetical protein
MSWCRGGALAVILIAVAFSSCGGSSSSSSVKTVTTTTTTATSTTSAPSPSPRRQLRACIKRFGARLASEPPTLKGRIAIGAAGNLPASYLGAVVFRNGAFSDVWVADNARGGADTADRLNKAQAQAAGVTEVEAAFSDGRAVSAPQNAKAFGEIGLDEARGLDRCLAAFNG